MWSVKTEYRNIDDWSKSQFGTIAQEWDPSPYWIQEIEHEHFLDLEGQSDIEARDICSPWYGLMWTYIQL